MTKEELLARFPAWQDLPPEGLRPNGSYYLIGFGSGGVLSEIDCAIHANVEVYALAESDNDDSAFRGLPFSLQGVLNARDTNLTPYQGKYSAGLTGNQEIVPMGSSIQISLRVGVGASADLANRITVAVAAAISPR